MLTLTYYVSTAYLTRAHNSSALNSAGSRNHVSEDAVDLNSDDTAGVIPGVMGHLLSPNAVLLFESAALLLSSHSTAAVIPEILP